MMLRKRKGMTIAELLISILIFSIFLIVLFSSLNIVINAMETQDMIVSKLYTASKINFLFGILEDEFKWLGSFGKGVENLGGPFDIANPKGFQATYHGTDVTFDYQYAVIENFVLQKKGASAYEKVFSDAVITNKVDFNGGEKYLVILSDNHMSSVATATVDNLIFNPSADATNATITLSNLYNPESHPATKIYFVRIREGNDETNTKPRDENGNTDYLEQLVRGKLTYDYDESKIFLNVKKGFSAFNSTMTILDDVDKFELSFYDSSSNSWTTNPTEDEYEDVRAIKSVITLNIPVSKSIEKRFGTENKNMIQLTKERVFWLPPEEELN
jgi:hypothetical protein